jgi:hypothetical protein
VAIEPGGELRMTFAALALRPIGEHEIARRRSRIRNKPQLSRIIAA